MGHLGLRRYSREHYSGLVSSSRPYRRSKSALLRVSEFLPRKNVDQPWLGGVDIFPYIEV
jgi:hypothetical protein